MRIIVERYSFISICIGNATIDKERKIMSFCLKKRKDVLKILE